MKSRLSLLLKLSFAVVSIALLLQFAPVPAILAALASVSLPWLLAGIALQFAVRLSATLRMRVVARNQGIDLGHIQLYRILLASQFYSIFLPGVLGGGAAWVKYIQHGAGQAAAAAVVVLNRAISISTVIALGFCAWLLDRVPSGPVVTAILLGAVAAGFAAAVAMAPRPAEPAPLEPSRNRIARQLRNLGGRFLRLLSLSRGDKLVVLAGTCIEVLVASAASWCFATAVGADIAFLSAVWVYAAMTLVLLIPVTVAGLGLREAGLVGFGAILGVAAPQAMAWSLAILFGTLLVAAAGGLLEANWTSRRLQRALERDGS